MDRFSRRVLRCMLKCQIDVGESVFVDYDSRRFRTVHDGSTPRWRIRSARFFMSGNKVKSSLAYLEELGYITPAGAGSYKFTHIGFVSAYGWFWRFLRFLVFSVLVPAVVAYFTSAFAYYIAHGEFMSYAILRYIRSLLASLL